MSYSHRTLTAPWLLVVAAFFLFSPLSVQATLIIRGTDSVGNRLIYDDDLDLTWYDFTHTISSWDGQVYWASNLTVVFNGVTFSDWRLPYTDETCGTGANCTTSELGHLYYVEFDDPIADRAPFLHLFNYDYWTGTEYSLNPSLAWEFNFSNGNQSAPVKNPSSSYGCKYCRAIAVRDGDVSTAGPSPIPEPPIALLFSAGLVGLGLAAFGKGSFVRE